MCPIDQDAYFGLPELFMPKYDEVSIKDQWPWFSRTIVETWRSWNADQNIKEGQEWKKEPMSQSIKDILRVK